MDIKHTFPVGTTVWAILYIDVGNGDFDSVPFLATVTEEVSVVTDEYRLFKGSVTVKESLTAITSVKKDMNIKAPPTFPDKLKKPSDYLAVPIVTEYEGDESFALHIAQGDYSDMTFLQNLNEAELNRVLETRLGRIAADPCLMFTYTGPTLVAVNMFDTKATPNPFGKRKMTDISLNAALNEPHIYSLTNRAYLECVTNNLNQAVIITGESGAGKSFQTKQVLDFLQFMAGDNPDNVPGEKSVADKLVDANPILEAFGNAKMPRNDDSSRYGKLFQIYFSNINKKIVGAELTCYLLEKSRVVTQGNNERNYHIFYQFIKGEKNIEKRKKFYLLDSCSDYKYLNPFLGDKSPMWTVVYDVGKDDNGVDLDESNYIRLNQAFETFNISDALINELWSVISAILLLGNLCYKEADVDGSEGCALVNPNLIDCIVNLLKLQSKDALIKSLLYDYRFLPSNNQEIFSPLTPDKAMMKRDAIAKSLYQKLFYWTERELINPRLNRPNPDLNYNFICVLDIFGFEFFDEKDCNERVHNSLEQMCINYCNEKLQNLFVETIFKEESKFYKTELPNEDINLNYEKYDNDRTLTMLRDIMIRKLFDQCKSDSGSDEKFLSSIFKDTMTNYPDLVRGPAVKKTVLLQNSFIVTHYAADVLYYNKNFKFKNIDKLSDDLLGILFASDHKHAVSPYFNLEEVKAAKIIPCVCSQFIENLESLYRILINCESQCRNFVRCIKSNRLKRPFRPDDNNKALNIRFYERGLILKQLQYTGMLATLKIRKEGYPIRYAPKIFYEKYKCFDSTVNDASGLLVSMLSQGLITSLNVKHGVNLVLLKDTTSRDLDEKRKSILKKSGGIVSSFLSAANARMHFNRALFTQHLRTAYVTTQIRNYYLMHQSSCNIVAVLTTKRRQLSFQSLITTTSEFQLMRKKAIANKMLNEIVNLVATIVNKNKEESIRDEQAAISSLTKEDIHLKSFYKVEIENEKETQKGLSDTDTYLRKVIAREKHLKYEAEQREIARIAEEKRLQKIKEEEEFIQNELLKQKRECEEMDKLETQQRKVEEIILLKIIKERKVITDMIKDCEAMFNDDDEVSIINYSQLLKTVNTSQINQNTNSSGSNSCSSGSQVSTMITSEEDCFTDSLTFELRLPNASYDYFRDPQNHEKLIGDYSDQIAKILNVMVPQITNVTVKKGSLLIRAKLHSGCGKTAKDLWLKLKNLLTSGDVKTITIDGKAYNIDVAYGVPEIGVAEKTYKSALLRSERMFLLYKSNIYNFLNDGRNRCSLIEMMTARHLSSIYVNLCYEYLSKLHDEQHQYSGNVQKSMDSFKKLVNDRLTSINNNKTALRESYEIDFQTKILKSNRLGRSHSIAEIEEQYINRRQKELDDDKITMERDLTAYELEYEVKYNQHRMFLQTRASETRTHLKQLFINELQRRDERIESLTSILRTEIDNNCHCLLTRQQLHDKYLPMYSNLLTLNFNKHIDEKITSLNTLMAIRSELSESKLSHREAELVIREQEYIQRESHDIEVNYNNKYLLEVEKNKKEKENMTNRRSIYYQKMADDKKNEIKYIYQRVDNELLKLNEESQRIIQNKQLVLKNFELEIDDRYRKQINESIGALQVTIQEAMRQEENSVEIFEALMEDKQNHFNKIKVNYDSNVTASNERKISQLEENDINSRKDLDSQYKREHQKRESQISIIKKNKNNLEEAIRDRIEGGRKLENGYRKNEQNLLRNLEERLALQLKKSNQMLEARDADEVKREAAAQESFKNYESEIKDNNESLIAELKESLASQYQASKDTYDKNRLNLKSSLDSVLGKYDVEIQQAQTRIHEMEMNVKQLTANITKNKNNILKSREERIMLRYEKLLAEYILVSNDVVNSRIEEEEALWQVREDQFQGHEESIEKSKNSYDMTMNNKCNILMQQISNDNVELLREMERQLKLEIKKRNFDIDDHGKRNQLLLEAYEDECHSQYESVIASLNKYNSSLIQQHESDDIHYKSTLIHELTNRDTLIADATRDLSQQYSTNVDTMIREINQKWKELQNDSDKWIEEKVVAKYNVKIALLQNQINLNKQIFNQLSHILKATYKNDSNEFIETEKLRISSLQRRLQVWYDKEGSIWSNEIQQLKNNLLLQFNHIYKDLVFKREVHNKEYYHYRTALRLAKSDYIAHLNSVFAPLEKEMDALASHHQTYVMTMKEYHTYTDEKEHVEELLFNAINSNQGLVSEEEPPVSPSVHHPSFEFLSSPDDNKEFTTTFLTDIHHLWDATRIDSNDKLIFLKSLFHAYTKSTQRKEESGSGDGGSGGVNYDDVLNVVETQVCKLQDRLPIMELINSCNNYKNIYIRHTSPSSSEGQLSQEEVDASIVEWKSIERQLEELVGTYEWKYKERLMLREMQILEVVREEKLLPSGYGV